MAKGIEKQWQYRGEGQPLVAPSGRGAGGYDSC